MPHITADSRNVTEGTIFVAIRGNSRNGEDFIQQAIDSGAKQIVVSSDFAKTEVSGVKYCYVENPRQYLAQQVALEAGVQPRHIVAVTGTNGKTSTVNFYKQICAIAGLKAATFGTIGIDTTHPKPNNLIEFGTTSPDPVSLHHNLALLKNESVEHIAIEASSHGLHQYRLDGVKFEAAAFTNLSQDHLDYHANMEEYFHSKARLFLELLANNGTAIINIDDEHGARLYQLCLKKNIKVVTYGTSAQADFRLYVEKPGLCFSHQDQDYNLPFSPVGAFQKYNAIAAILLAFKSGVDVDMALKESASLIAPEGRLQKIEDKGGLNRQVFIDYAHTPDALEQALLALKPYLKEGARLMVVFGCGGDRDSSKRPQMGKAASKHADIVYITDDNPRTESAAEIRKQILMAAPDAIEISGRSAAIAQAISAMKSQDILLIAGKGHETYQIIGKEKAYFNDAEEAAKAMSYTKFHF